ncbi:TRAP transporter small permease subunit [Oceanibacterium hippocampi]|uniref:TRAP transporter small permease protein n=1 Tax=Oceanibacterium hippocampi TaxID=745714 RepID=A0A1Y5TSF0_9PROT|nr:TRAP transporter small permease [Oceanibacterium hippocampi]SLN71160.1 Tripartite ATP-independent periplasmic transporters, DctQ component [Oceanibacterium hippocampi]
MRYALAWIDRAIGLLVRAAFTLASIAMLAIMAIGTIDVIGTYLLHSPVPAGLELQEVLLVLVIFLGLGHAQSRREHIEVDIITSMMGVGIRRWFELFALFAGALAFGLIGWRAWDLALASWKVGETANAVFSFPIYPSKFLVAAGASVAALECMRQIGRWFASKSIQAPDQPEAE